MAIRNGRDVPKGSKRCADTGKQSWLREKKKKERWKKRKIKSVDFLAYGWGVRFENSCQRGRR